MDLLAGLPALRDCPPAELARLAALVHEARLPAGHVVRRAGERSRFAVMVVEGRVHLVEAETVVAELGPGSVVGASATGPAGHPSGAALVTATDATLFLIDRRYLAAVTAP